MDTKKAKVTFKKAKLKRLKRLKSEIHENKKSHSLSYRSPSHSLLDACFQFSLSCFPPPSFFLSLTLLVLLAHTLSPPSSTTTTSSSCSPLRQTEEKSEHSSF